MQLEHKDLQNLRSKLFGALQDHSLIVFTVLLPYPGIGLSYGMANTTLKENSFIIKYL